MYEACVGNYNEAISAFKRGANRIELCDNLMEDGTTPSVGTIKKTIKDVNIPVMVIIRPRGGNFEYTDLIEAKKLGTDGVVFGCLTPSGWLDEEALELLIETAEGLQITFHMAFDEIEDKFKAIDQLVELGVDRILTKGGCENALAGRESLKKLVEYANDRITIMPGKGVNKENRDYILEYTGAKEIHGTKVV